MIHGEKLCLWNGRALFVGRLPDLELHQQAAAVVCVGIDKPFELARENAGWISCRTALIGPQVMHALRPAGAVCAFLFFDPDNADYDYLLKSNNAGTGPAIFFSLKEEPRLLRHMSALYAAENETSLCEILARLEFTGGTEAQDYRIQLVMRKLATDPGESVPIEELAALAEVSPSRLAHLFKEQVGIPIRMFRTWFRLKNAVTFLKDGMSLTDAALRAGFYDSAHFANTFKETFGLSPKVVFGAQRKLHWYVGESRLAPV